MQLQRKRARYNIISVLAVLFLLIGSLPATAFAEEAINGAAETEQTATVRLIVENTLWSEADGAPWSGTLLEETIDLEDNATALKLLQDGLQQKYLPKPEIDHENHVIQIKGLANGDAGTDCQWEVSIDGKSGSTDFAGCTAANGALRNGSVIRVQYCGTAAELPQENSAAENAEKEADANPEEPEQAAECEIVPEEQSLQGLSGQAAVKVDEKVNNACQSTGKYLSDAAGKTAPTINSVGGEWLILGLSRSNYGVKQDLYDAYLNDVIRILKAQNGILDSRKYTEYSRVILALTALGEDVTDVGGYNLMEPLADFEQVVWQGINGPIYALIAADSHSYQFPSVSQGKKQTSRENLIAYILEHQRWDGGWSLSEDANDRSDIDVTAMALQALAPYVETNLQAQIAVQIGLEMISEKQSEDGGFSSWGNANSESCAQVIVALTALGIDPEKDERFIKNGNSVLDALLAFQLKDGSFRHTPSGGSNGMSTEQAYYALTAYQRLVNGDTSLYDMSDVALKTDAEKVAAVERLIDAIRMPVSLKDEAAIKKALTAYQNLSKRRQAMVAADKVKKLTEAELALSGAQVKQVEALIDAIGTVTLDREQAIIAANTAYNSLSDAQKAKVGNYDVLQRALVKLKRLKEAAKSGPQQGTAATLGTTKALTKSVQIQFEDEEQEHVAEFLSLLQRFLNGTTAGTLPEQTANYTEKQVQAALDVYRAYRDLSEIERLAAAQDESWEKFSDILTQLGRGYHYDKETGVDLRDNEEEALPWHIQVVVRPRALTEAQELSVAEALGGESQMFSMFEISFVNVLDGSEWHPTHVQTVKLPMPDLGDYESALVIHLADHGKMDLIAGSVEDHTMRFEAAEFSMYGIAGFMGSVDTLIGVQTVKAIWPWITLAVLALIAFIWIAARRRKHNP